MQFCFEMLGFCVRNVVLTNVLMFILLLFFPRFVLGFWYLLLPMEDLCLAHLSLCFKF